MMSKPKSTLLKMLSCMALTSSPLIDNSQRRPKEKEKPKTPPKGCEKCRCRRVKHLKGNKGRSVRYKCLSCGHITEFFYKGKLK